MLCVPGWLSTFELACATVGIDDDWDTMYSGSQEVNPHRKTRFSHVQLFSTKSQWSFSGESLDQMRNHLTPGESACQSHDDETHVSRTVPPETTTGWKSHHSSPESTRQSPEAARLVHRRMHANRFEPWSRRNHCSCRALLRLWVDAFQWRPSLR